jgi:hypothetical protein
MNLCPVCAELVRDDLDVCPNCDSDLWSKENIKKSNKLSYDLKFKNTKTRRKSIDKLNKTR